MAHPRRREALRAVLEVDGRDEWWPELEPPDPTEWDTPDKLAAALSRAGLAGLGGAVFPTGQLSVIVGCRLGKVSSRAGSGRSARVARAA